VLTLQAQKPWMKKYSKVIKAKKEYYSVCKQDRAATVQENTLRGASDTPADQVFVDMFMLHSIDYIYVLTIGSTH